MPSGTYGMVKRSVSTQQRSADEKKVVKDICRYALREGLSVVINFSLDYDLNEEEACLLQWASYISTV